MFLAIQRHKGGYEAALMRTSIWLVLSLGAFCPGAGAQSVFGTIHGVVLDASGSVVSGAKLTLREVGRNTVNTTESTSIGRYEFLNVPSGLYEVTAEKAGFLVTRTQPIGLEARQTQRADFTLEVATRADLIVVQARAPVIDTEDGTLSDTKNFQQLARLPLNFRGRGGTAISAILTFPGVQQDLGGFGWSISGGLPVQADISVDGISAMYVPFHIPLGDIAPSVEIVDEMKVSSVGNNANFGAMGDVTLSSRSGTNQLHGGMFWYHQNGALDANTYNSLTKPPKVFNTVGASVGGPVVLPGVYSGRNRTFFFTDFETNLQRSWHLAQRSVPTSAMRNGLLDGLPGGVVNDPSTGLPFPGNEIPATRISNVSRVLLSKYYAFPNVPGDLANNLRFPGDDNQQTYGFDVRVDHVISAKQEMFARWSWKNNSMMNTSWAPLPPSPNPGYDRTFVAAHTYAPRADLSNELRYGFTLTSTAEYFPIKGKDAVAALGLQGLDLSNAGDLGGFPAFQLNGSSGLASVGHGRDQFEAGRNYQLSDTLSWVRDRHTLKFGAEVRRVGLRSALSKNVGGDDFGTFVFNGTFTGNDFGDLLLGLPSSSTTAVLGPNPNLVVNYFNVFIQDTWKIGRRFVLDVGLRTEVHPAMSEQSGNMANFDPVTGDVIVPDHSIAPAPGFLSAIGACPPAGGTPGCTRVLTASQAGLPAGLRQTNVDWNPRLGFAWRPTGSDKMSIRGSIGTYTATLLGQMGGAMVGIHSSDVRDFNNVSSTGKPLFTFPNVSPSPDSLGTIAVASFSRGVAAEFKDPRSYQWNVTFERELPWSMTLRASYVGVQSVGLAEKVDFNQVRASAQPFSASLRPFSHWVQLLSIQNLGFSNYQGLHLEWSRRFKNDLFFQASYQLAKDLGSLGSTGTPNLPWEIGNIPVTDRFNTRYDRGNLPGIRRQRFLLTALAPIPFGKGRSMGSHWSRVPNAFFGGWEVSTVTLLESGPFQTPNVPPGRDQSNTDAFNRFFVRRPDRITGVNPLNPVGDRYYDPSAFDFVPAGAGRFGNAGAGILEGPGTVSIAAGLAKTFQPLERLRARFEATFLNVANHPNFAPPGVTLGTPNFGRLLAVQSTENAGNRMGQVGIRLEF